MRVGPYHDRVVQEVVAQGTPWLDNYSAVVRYIILDWARLKDAETTENGGNVVRFSIAKLMDIIDNRDNI